MPAALHRTVVRVITPVVLVALIALQFALGADSLPGWVANASIKMGAGPETAVRALMVAEFMGAVLPVVLPGMAALIAWVLFGALAFTGLADLSAILTAPGQAAVPFKFWVLPTASLIVGGAGIWALQSSGEAARAERAAQAAAGKARGPLAVWQVMVVIVLLGAAMATAPRIPIAERSAQLMNGIETVILDPDSWEGKTIPATGLARYLPPLTPLTLEGTKWIVFFQPSCGRCHEVFDGYFAGDNLKTVIAVEIPHAPDEKVLNVEERGDIHCENCTRLALPDTYKWMGLTSPTIVKVENGTVTCVTSRDYDRCRKGSGTVE